jgi:hypothetical protein
VYTIRIKNTLNRRWQIDLEIPLKSTDYVQKAMKDGESHDYIQNQGENTGA